MFHGVPQLVAGSNLPSPWENDTGIDSFITQKDGTTFFRQRDKAINYDYFMDRSRMGFSTLWIWPPVAEGGHHCHFSHPCNHEDLA